MNKIEKINLKEESKKCTEEIKGSVTALIQIMANDDDNIVAYVGGMPSNIITALSKVMRKNPQIKKFIEAAWIASSDLSFNSNIKN